MKDLELNKKLLCVEDSENCKYYENFVIQILNKLNTSKLFAITSDCNKKFTREIVCINACHNLALHDKKVLLIDLDIFSNVIEKVVNAQKQNNTIVKFDNFDVVLASSIDFILNLSKEQLEEKYAQYDVVVFNVPSPKTNNEYLALPSKIATFILLTKYFSNYYSANKIIQKLRKLDVNLLGSVFIRLK